MKEVRHQIAHSGKGYRMHPFTLRFHAVDAVISDRCHRPTRPPSPACGCWAAPSPILVIFRKERESEEIERLRQYESLSSFLDTWARFEQASKEALSKEQEDFNKHSLRSVISRLYEEAKINKDDVNALEEALQVRNAIVHGGPVVPAQITDKIIVLLVEIIRKLRSNSAPHATP